MQQVSVYTLYSALYILETLYIPLTKYNLRSQIRNKLQNMARYFREEDIDEFRECFYLFARSGQIRTMDELTIIMRSLGLSPTISELNVYLKEKDGKMSFADFLEVMHLQTTTENLPKEIIEAFRAADPNRTGSISAYQLANMLLNWGEKLSNKEVEQIFREANVSLNGQVKYEDFVKIACAPVPDYY